MDVNPALLPLEKQGKNKESKKRSTKREYANNLFLALMKNKKNANAILSDIERNIGKNASKIELKEYADVMNRLTASCKSYQEKYIPMYQERLRKQEEDKEQLSTATFDFQQMTAIDEKVFSQQAINNGMQRSKEILETLAPIRTKLRSKIQKNYPELLKSNHVLDAASTVIEKGDSPTMKLEQHTEKQASNNSFNLTPTKKAAQELEQEKLEKKSKIKAGFKKATTYPLIIEEARIYDREFSQYLHYGIIKNNHAVIDQFTTLLDGLRDDSASGADKIFLRDFTLVYLTQFQEKFLQRKKTSSKSKKGYEQVEKAIAMLSKLLPSAPKKSSNEKQSIEFTRINARRLPTKKPWTERLARLFGRGGK
jgi:hypothetical protein